MPVLPAIPARSAIYDAAISMLAPREFQSGNNDFDTQYTDIQDTVESGRLVVSGGIIAVIVVIAVGFIAACIIGYCICTRTQHRRGERLKVGPPNSGSTYPHYGPPAADNPIANPPPAYVPSQTGSPYDRGTTRDHTDDHSGGCSGHKGGHSSHIGDYSSHSGGCSGHSGGCSGGNTGGM